MSLSSILPISVQFCPCRGVGRSAAGQVSATIPPSEAEGAEARLSYTCFGDLAKLKTGRGYFSHGADLTIGINGK